MEMIQPVGIRLCGFLILDGSWLHSCSLLFGSSDYDNYFEGLR